MTLLLVIPAACFALAAAIAVWVFATACDLDPDDPAGYSDREIDELLGYKRLGVPRQDERR